MWGASGRRREHVKVMEQAESLIEVASRCWLMMELVAVSVPNQPRDVQVSSKSTEYMVALQ
jgi:hypothetical protein